MNVITDNTKVLQEILNAVCDVMDCEPEDVGSKSLRRIHVTARQLYCYACHDLTGITPPVIGELINRDRDTVVRLVTEYQLHTSTDDNWAYSLIKAYNYVKIKLGYE